MDITVEIVCQGGQIVLDLVDVKACSQRFQGIGDSLHFEQGRPTMGGDFVARFKLIHAQSIRRHKGGHLVNNSRVIGALQFETS